MKADTVLDLASDYRSNVTGGKGSFVLKVHGVAGFGDAMTRRLVTEIAGTAAGPPLYRSALLHRVPTGQPKRLHTDARGEFEWGF